MRYFADSFHLSLPHSGLFLGVHFTLIQGGRALPFPLLLNKCREVGTENQKETHIVAFQCNLPCLGHCHCNIYNQHQGGLQVCTVLPSHCSYISGCRFWKNGANENGMPTYPVDK